MRNLKSYIASLLFVAIGLTGCQDDFDNPVLQGPEATIGANTSILDLKTAYWNKTDSNYIDNIDDSFKNYISTIGTKENGEHIVIAGRVISSDRSGNIYKNLVIQDETGALTLSINQSGLYNNYRIGQEVVIDVTDMHIGKYNGLQQLGWPDYTEEYGWQATFMPFAFFTQHTQLNGLPEPEKVDTVLMSLENLSSADLIKYQSQLVRFNNVRFANEDGEFADGSMSYTDGSEINSNRALYDENGNTIVVRNSGYASFWSDKLPVGYGDVVGILSYYGDAWQLVLRSTDDCMNFGNPTLSPGTESNPYTVEQAIALEEAGETPSGWVTGYIVGAVGPDVENTITSSNDIEWGAPTTLANTLVIAPADTINDITKCLVISLPQDSKLREYANLKDNADNLGKQIWLLGKLEKFMDTYGITGNRGTVSEFKLEGLEAPGGEIPAGDGTENSPYNVTQILGGVSGSDVWTEGYIVGWVDGAKIAEGSHFSVPSTSASNVLIAATPDETDYTKCVPVQLVSGTDVRAAVNLKDHPENLGKKLSYKGNIATYFGVPGLKEGTAYKLTGEGSGGNTTETPEGEGDGSETSPFNVAKIQSGATGTDVWSVGYIVGWVEGAKLAEGSHFSVPSSSASNVLIADTPTETDYTKCVPVQLVSGTDVRAAVNLMDNPGNLGKKLSYKGNITTYFGVPGLKEGTAYKLDGKGSGSETPENPTTTVSYKKVTSITSGKEYLIVANGKAAQTLTGNYGYLKVADVTDNSGVIETETGNGFVFTTTTGGYTITDANGKYVYMTGTYNSFNVDATMPASGAVWTVEPKSDGTFVITNVQMNKSIQFDSQYTSYGAYSDVRGTYPTLYEIVDGNDNPGGNDTPDTPTPSGNTADFNTMNDGKASSQYTTPFTSAAGWTTVNCCLLRGTTGSDANPNFSFLGDDSVFAPCLNGKVGASGIVTSPTISGGIKTLTFNYGFAYSETKCKFTVNIKQNGSVVQSKTEEITSITKMAVYSFAMDVNVSGDFVIEIVNDCLSQATGNKDRVAIWNLSWTN